jgi:hypothetical protein
MYGTYEGVTLCGKPSGATYDLIKDIISCGSGIMQNHLLLLSTILSHGRSMYLAFLFSKPGEAFDSKR